MQMSQKPIYYIYVKEIWIKEGLWTNDNTFIYLAYK